MMSAPNVIRWVNAAVGVYVIVDPPVHRSASLVSWIFWMSATEIHASPYGRTCDASRGSPFCALPVSDDQLFPPSSGCTWSIANDDRRSKFSLSDAAQFTFTRTLLLLWS